jgi:serine/threonine protein kinase
VDVWALGCTVYYLIMKRDPFDGRDPREIKQNILTLRIDDNYMLAIPDFFKPLFQYIFIFDEHQRPTTSQVHSFIESKYAQYLTPIQHETSNS